MPTRQTVDARYIEILKKYDSSTICNVIELFKIQPQTEGFLHHSIRALFPELPPMAGYAVTCKFTSAKKGEGTLEYNDIGKHVDALLTVPAPRVMVFQDIDDDTVGASFGEMLAATYMTFGCVGIITSGGARDAISIRKRKLPPKIALMCERFIEVEDEWANYVDSGGAAAEGIRTILAKFGNLRKQASEQMHRNVTETE